MFDVTKTFKFEGAHVLESSYSLECQNIHGHSYVVDVVLEATSLNVDGMAVDFKLMKELVAPIFDELDHALLMHKNSYDRFSAKCPDHMGWKVISFGDLNPTAENMAKYFFYKIQDILSKCVTNAYVAEVIVAETRTGKACYFEV